MTFSADGERQMLPMQTKSRDEIGVELDIEGGSFSDALRFGNWILKKGMLEMRHQVYGGVSGRNTKQGAKVLLKEEVVREGFGLMDRLCWG